MLVAGITQAQFGLGGKYLKVHEGGWHDVFAAAGGTYTDQLSSVSAFYWFRLKQKRVEFLPEIGYFTALKKSVDTGAPNQMRGAFINWNTDFYFLDFASDCNCPTFSKQNDLLKRGLFVEVTPGVEFRKLDIDFVKDNRLETRTFSHTVVKLYLGLGFDLGLSDLITVTPTAGLSYVMNTDWGVEVEEFLDVANSDFSRRNPNREVITNVGVRLIFRPDYTRR